MWTKETKKRYTDAHMVYQMKSTPISVKDHGFVNTIYPDVRTSNGLTLAIKNHLSWTGNYANRINTTGRLIRTKYKSPAGGRTVFEDKWIPGATTKGSSDLSCIIKNRIGFPYAVHIEIKVGRDVQSDDQKKQQKKVEQAGGKYIIIRTIEEYFEFYDRLFNEAI